MQVANPNNIKIYNLSAGKSLPEVRRVELLPRVITHYFLPG